MDNLDQHNDKVRFNKDFAGVICPKCKQQEMIFPDNLILESLPPQRNVKCPKCGYFGTKMLRD